MTVDVELYNAVKKQDADEIRRLLATGANPHTLIDGQESSLHLAAREGYVEFFALIPNDKLVVDIKNSSDETPLHLANDAETAKQLIALRAQINVFDNKYKTPLVRAIINGKFDVAIFLLRKGADQNPEGIPYYCYSPFWYAIGHACSSYVYINVGDILELLGELIDRGADIEQKHGLYQASPLHSVAVYSRRNNGDRLAILSFLISKGAAIESTHSKDFIPLHSYLWWNHDLPHSIDIVRLLCRSGIVNHRNKYGLTAIFGAIRPGEFEIVKCLVEEFWASLEYSDLKSNENVLHYAVEKFSEDDNWQEMLDYLISKGANVNQKNYHGYTAAEDAALAGKHQMANYLHKHMYPKVAALSLPTQVQPPNPDLEMIRDLIKSNQFRYQVYSDSNSYGNSECNTLANSLYQLYLNNNSEDDALILKAIEQLTDELNVYDLCTRFLRKIESYSVRIEFVLKIFKYIPDLINEQFFHHSNDFYVSILSVLIRDDSNLETLKEVELTYPALDLHRVLYRDGNAIQSACMPNSPKILTWLLSRKVSAALVSDDPETPLSSALYHYWLGHYPDHEVIDILLDHGKTNDLNINQICFWWLGDTFNPLFNEYKATSLAFAVNFMPDAILVKLLKVKKLIISPETVSLHGESVDVFIKRIISLAVNYPTVKPISIMAQLFAGNENKCFRYLSRYNRELAIEPSSLNNDIDFMRIHYLANCLVNNRNSLFDLNFRLSKPIKNSEVVSSLTCNRYLANFLVILLKRIFLGQSSTISLVEVFLTEKTKFFNDDIVVKENMDLIIMDRLMRMFDHSSVGDIKYSKDCIRIIAFSHLKYSVHRMKSLGIDHSLINNRIEIARKLAIFESPYYQKEIGRIFGSPTELHIKDNRTAIKRWFG